MSGPQRTPNASPTLRAEDRDEFEAALYHITHDLGAMMRAMRTLPGWVREDLEAEGVQLSDTVRQSLGMLETNAARAETLLEDLLTYSRVGRGDEAASDVDLAQAVREAAGAVGLPEGFRLETAFEVPVVRAPEAACGLLFHALLSNAIVHHDRTEGRIRVTSREEGGTVVLRVEDDGPGIPAQHLDAVFAMMTRLKSRDECEGSGLGLSIARKIVHGWGGGIRALDTGGRGTTIEITLPAGGPRPGA